VLAAISQAIESFALCVGQWGWVRRDALPQRTDVLLFSAATAAICHCYSDGCGRHRDVFRSKYLNVLDFILGNTGASAQAAAGWPLCSPPLRTAQLESADVRVHDVFSLHLGRSTP
jgi:hypothetical protein